MRFAFLVASFFVLTSCQFQESPETSGGLSGRFKNEEVSEELLNEHRQNRYQQFEEMVNLHNKEKGQEEIYYEVERICRTFLGCIKMCSYLQSEDCTFLSAPEVLELFEETVSNGSFEEMVTHVEWVFKDSHVSYYFQHVDQNQEILSKIISNFSGRSCPLFKNRDVFYEESDSKISLYVVQEDKSKKMVDSTQHSFEFPLFKGVMSQCLEQGSRHIFDISMEYKNGHGFILGHQLLDKSCGSNASCIQLAYCRMDSEEILNHARDVLGIENLQCEYENLNSLSSPLSSQKELGASQDDLHSLPLSSQKELETSQDDLHSSPLQSEKQESVLEIETPLEESEELSAETKGLEVENSNHSSTDLVGEDLL